MPCATLSPRSLPACAFASSPTRCRSTWSRARIPRRRPPQVSALPACARGPGWSAASSWPARRPRAATACKRGCPWIRPHDPGPDRGRPGTRADRLPAIRIVFRGDAVVAPALTRRLFERYLATAEGPPRVDAAASLTPREQEVLEQVARGLSN